MENKETENKQYEKATLGAGCFWCVEAVFQKLEGVISVLPGYSGGHIKNPSYREVCSGRTGHAEVCQIQFDPSKVTFTEILQVYWQTHDPTTVDRQGNDVGEQYRSVIFYHDEIQKKIAEELKAKLDSEKIWADPIVTEIIPFEAFYEAEDYHHDYYTNNTDQPYCSFVITPKVEKFRKIFADKLKKTAVH